MASEATTKRVTELVDRSLESSASGDFSGASAAAREALKLDPNDERVKKALDAAKASESHADACELIRKYVLDGDVEVSRAAVKALSSETLDETKASEMLELLTVERDDRPRCDRLTAAILGQSAGKKVLVRKISTETTLTFRSFWGTGELSAVAVIAVLQEMSLWPDEKLRAKIEADIFMLLVARMMEPAIEDEELIVLMKSVARLLPVSAQALAPLIDVPVFDEIMACLKINKPTELRSQATLVIAQFLEAAPSSGQKLLADYMIDHTSKRNGNEFVLAFSAAAAIFPVLPNIAASQFLREGFVGDVIRLMERSQIKALRQAALELLSAACIDTPCRDAIRNQCTPALKGLVMSHEDTEAALAALVLAKIETHPSSNNAKNDELTPLFKTLIEKDDNSWIQATAIEGLAYRSVDSSVKEMIVSDEKFLTFLISILKDQIRSLSDAQPVVSSKEIKSGPGPFLFGGLSILSNLTTYPVRMTAEEKRLSELRAYANRSKAATDPEPLETEEKVSARCRKVLDAGVVSLLIVVASPRGNPSPVVLKLVSSIALALVKHPQHRGKMAQEGITDTLVTLANLDTVSLRPPSRSSATSKVNSNSSSQIMQAKQQAALALAQLLIAVDPSLIFQSITTRSSKSVQASIRALTQLLRPAASTEEFFSTSSASPADDIDALNPRETYAAVEALRAVTNLATIPAALGPTVAGMFDFMEACFSCNVSQLRLAAVQLLANLCAVSQQGLDHVHPAVSKLALDGQATTTRLRIIIALLKSWADEEDEKTGKNIALATSTILAMVTGYAQGVTAFVALPSGVEDVVEVLSEIVDDKDATFRSGLSHRLGLVLINITDPESPKDERMQANNRLKDASIEKTCTILLKAGGLGSEVQALLKEVTSRTS